MPRIAILNQFHNGRDHIYFLHLIPLVLEHGLTGPCCKKNKGEKNKPLSEIGKSNFSKLSFSAFIVIVPVIISFFLKRIYNLNWRQE